MVNRVQFDEEESLDYGTGIREIPEKQSFLTGLAFKLGAKDEKQANMMLLATSAIFLLVTVVLFARLAGFGIPFIGSSGQNSVDTDDLHPEIQDLIRGAQ